METYRRSCLISILLIFSDIGLINAKFLSQTIARQHLVQDLFTNYNPTIFPAHQDTRIDVTLHINFHHFNFRPSDGRFEFFGMLNVSWPDHKLHWKPMDYNNVSEVYVPRMSIWVPDFEFYYNAADKFLCMKDNGLVSVESSGRVTWVNKIEANIACEFETLRWPNDRHKCILILGSWTNDGNMIDFDNATRNSIISTKEIAKNPEFKILNHTVEYVSTIYSCCEEPYVTLNYILELERRASFVVIFQMPALCVIILTLGAFCLESYRGEKLLLHGISIFLIVAQLLYFAQNMKQFQFAHELPKCDENQETSETWNTTTLEQLHAQIFTNYDKNLQPTNEGEPIHVDIRLSALNIYIDEMNSRMTFYGWLRINWTDEKLTWNSSEYNNITEIHVQPSQMWTPNITFFNAAGPGSAYIVPTPIIIYGVPPIFWVLPIVVTVYCNLYLLRWPFDTQTCDLNIGTWSNVNISFPSEPFNEETLIYDEWNIVENKASLQTKHHHRYIQFSFLLERRSSMYTAVIFTPASCIVLLAVSVFWLPPQMGEKILVNGIVIVVISAFLIYFAQLLPILAGNAPLVVLFYSSSLLLLSISTIIAVIVLYLSSAEHKSRVPDFLKDLLNGTLGKILCLSQFSVESEPHSLLNNGTKELGEHVYDNPDNDNPDPLSINPMASSPTSRSTQCDWILLATAVDRICFLCYCIIFICLAIGYST